MSSDTPSIPNPLDHALRYAEMGWPVLPLHTMNGHGCTCGKADCTSPAKHPQTSHGLKDATTDADAIDRYWRQWPDANVGIRTGGAPQGAGVFVLDIDPRHGGDESLAEWVRLHGELPDTVEAVTGGGGRHFVFAYPPEETGGVIRNRSNVRPGIDIRGDGGYVVTAPSQHAAGNAYRWREGHGSRDLQPAPAPAWLLDAIRDKPTPSPASTQWGDTSTRPHDRSTACLTGLLRIDMADHQDGSKRLFTAACRCVEHDLTDTEALNTIRAYERVRPFPTAWTDTHIFARLRDAERTVTRGKVIQNHGQSALVAPDPTTWPDPKPLPGEHTPVAPFTMGLLPSILRAYVADVADRLQCPPDFVAAPLICVLGVAIGRRQGIRPKRHDDWLVVPNLWGFIVGRPSLMKTPAIKQPLSLLQRREAQAKKQFDDAMQTYEAEYLLAKRRKSKIVNSSDDDTDVGNLVGKIKACTPAVPIRQRFITNDTTVEKLGELLNENPHGMLVFRDELTGWLYNLEKDGQQGARAFYLEAWDGTGAFTYDRIGRGTIDIESACVSIFGGIQPGKLVPYVCGAVKGGIDDDGLLQRFQIVVWPDPPKTWRNVDRWPDTDAQNAVVALIDRFLTLGTGSPGEAPADDPASIPWLQFDESAQEAFDVWREKLELRLRAGEDHAAVESHLGKYRSLTPSLALIFHLCDHEDGPVGLAAIERSIRWGDYLESHTRRIYAAAIASDASTAKLILQRIQRGDVQDPFTARDIYHANWSGLSDREAVKAALALLTDYGWIAPMERDPRPGRPTVRYAIHPAARQKK